MSSQMLESSFRNTINLEQTCQNLRVVRELDEQIWKQFVEEQPNGNIFHSPEMFQVFSRAKGFDPRLWAAVGANGQVEALFLPVQVTLNRLLGPLTTRAISYGSVLCLPSAEGRRALELLLEAYVRETGGSCLFTELRNISDLPEEQPILLRQGFAYEEYVNYLIDLNLPPDQVLMNIGARTRKNIKHGLNKGEVTIREVTEAGQIKICYSLLSQTYLAARVPLADRSLFEAAFAVLHPKKMVRFCLAYVGETPVAVSVELLYKQVMLGWYGGIDRAYSKYIPYDLLMWEILKWGSGQGYAVYDFGGAGKPDEKYGVRDHKAKFGGKLVSYGRNTFVHLPAALWLSRRAYQVLRQLFNGHFPGQ